MATMLAVVATGGQRPHPHLIKGEAFPPERVPLAPATLAVVRGALLAAVEQGTGRRAGIERIEIAGKTGTAQVYRHSAGIDSDTLPKPERDHAWFAGYAPAAAPRIAFAVVVEHGGHGGTTAAPVVRRVLEVFFGEPVEAGSEVRAEVGDGGAATAG
jgi:penicillin-binding protein 2